MFPVPQPDHRLKNKDEIVGLLFGDERRDPLALDVRFLQNHTIYQSKIASIEFVILTDEAGAVRVYKHPNDLLFVSWDGISNLIDNSGNQWSLTEESLTNQHGSESLRLPSHRAFWFGWHAAFPDTKLVQ